MLGRQMPWKPSQPPMKSQPSSWRAPVLREADPRPRPVDLVQSDVLDPEADLAAGGEPGRDQVLDDLVLAVDGDPAPAAEPGEVDALAAAGEAQLQPLVDQAFALHARADAGLDEQVGGALLEHARADPLLDVLSAVALEHHRGDALEMQQVRQQEPRRPGADDANLGLHGSAVSALPRRSSCHRRRPAPRSAPGGFWPNARHAVF